MDTSRKDLLGELAASRDLVIIDSSPLSVSGEALSLARRVDGVILVAGRGLTRSRALLGARKALGQAGGKVLGAVLSGGRRPRRDSRPARTPPSPINARPSAAVW